MNPLTSRVAQRLSFAKIPEVLPLPDLLEVQHESFRWFLDEGLKEIFEEISPIEDFTGSLALELTDHRFGEPPMTIDEAKDHDANYATPLFVTARFFNRQTGEIKEQQVFLGDFPIMTEKGVFIVNGTERVVVSQLVRSPGVYFDQTLDKTSDRDIFSAKMIPGRGAWLEFDTDKRDTLGVRVDRKRRQYVSAFLRALGIAETDEEILALFDGAESIRNTLERDPVTDKDEALLDLYRKLRPGEPTNGRVGPEPDADPVPQPEAVRPDPGGALQARPEVRPARGRRAPLRRAGLLSDDDILDTIRYLVHLHAGTPTFTPTNGTEVPVQTDDIDHFGNRRVRTVGELIQNQVRVGLTRLERVVRERMTTQDPESITPQSLINIRPVTAAIKEFFGTSQLSQFMDQPNPLAGLTHRRRLSALGPGVSRGARRVRGARRPSLALRADVPHRDPGGPEHRADRFARQLRPGQPLRLHRDPVSQGGQGQGQLDRRLPHRYRGGAARHRPGQRPAQPGRVVPARPGVGAPRRWRGRPGDAGRGRLHGRLAQAARLGLDRIDPLPRARRRQPRPHGLQHAASGGASAPLRGPAGGHRGRGQRAAMDSGDMVVSPIAGEVVEVSGDHIVVKESGTNRKHTFPLGKFVRSNQGTCMNQKAIVREGDQGEGGRRARRRALHRVGRVGLGRNLLVAFMPWEGHNFEDAIIVSERLVKEDMLTSIHIEEHEIDARDTKLGAEEITRDIPNVAEEVLRRPRRERDHPGRRRGKPRRLPRGQGDAKGETELTPEERLLRAIFGEKAREVRDTSLKVPHGESGKVIDVRVAKRSEGYDLPPGVNETVRVYVAQQRKISEGDKLAGRHGNKGVIAKILPEEDMPFMEDGTPVDIILSPLGVPSRMNLGQVLETHLGWAAARGWRSSTARARRRAAPPPGPRWLPRCSTVPGRRRSHRSSPVPSPTGTATSWSTTSARRGSTTVATAMPSTPR